MYVQYGRIQKAQELVHKKHDENTILWFAMITRYA